MRYTEAWPFMKAAVQQPQFDGRDRLPINLPIRKAQHSPSPVLGSPHVIPELVEGPRHRILSESPCPSARATTNALPVRLSRLWLAVSTRAQAHSFVFTGLICAWKEGSLEFGSDLSSKKKEKNLDQIVKGLEGL